MGITPDENPYPEYWAGALVKVRVAWMGAFVIISLKFMPSHRWTDILGILFPPESGKKLSTGPNKIAATALLACTNTSILVSADTSIRSPRKSFGLEIKYTIYWINVLRTKKNNLILEMNSLTNTCTSFKTLVCCGIKIWTNKNDWRAYAISNERVRACSIVRSGSTLIDYIEKNPFICKESDALCHARIQVFPIRLEFNILAHAFSCVVV